MRRILLIPVAGVLLIGFSSLGVSKLRTTDHQLKIQDVQLQERGAELKSLELKYENLNIELEHTDTTNKAEIERLQKEKEQLDADKQRLEAELQSKIERREAERVAVEQRRKQLANAVTLTETANAQGAIDCKNQNSAKAFIYCHESGNRPNAVNAGGCRGLGQACPGSKLPCGSLDYACQDAWFTDYMKKRYGTWEAAKNHWQARVKINGRDVGHWW